MRSLRGKTVLIMGAASGIGRAMAEWFAREGCVLQLVDLYETDLQTVVSDLRKAGADCDGLVCDLSEVTEIATTVDRILESRGHLDVLINNARICC